MSPGYRRLGLLLLMGNGFRSAASVVRGYWSYPMNSGICRSTMSA